MKLFKQILVIAMSVCLFGICDVNKTIVHAEDFRDFINIQPFGQIIPVNKNFSVYASSENGGYAFVMFHVKGSYEKGSNSVTNVNLNYTYYVIVNGITSYSVESANIIYKTIGNTLYAVATVTLKVVSNGKTSYISGSKTVQL